VFEMLGTDDMSKDLREVIDDGIAAGTEVGGYLMRYTFIDQSLLAPDNALVQELQNLTEETNFYFEHRAMNDGLVQIPQVDYIWEGGLETFDDLFPMRIKIKETIGEKAHLAHIVFLPPDFTMEGGEEE
jgi:hypothetical protein